jgi:hypothetical protein
MFGCRYVYVQVTTEGHHQYTQSGHASLCERCAVSGHAGLQPLTKGQHQPNASKKKKTHEVGLFFLVPTLL